MKWNTDGNRDDVITALKIEGKYKLNKSKNVENVQVCRMHDKRMAILFLVLIS